MTTPIGSGMDITELRDLTNNIQEVLMQGPYLVQPLQDFTASRLGFDMKGQMADPYGEGKTWNVQTHYAQNSTSAARPFMPTWEVEREDYTTQLRSVTKTEYTHKKNVYDVIALNEQRKNKTAVGNIVKQVLTANIIGRQMAREDVVIGPHYADDAEGYQGVLGLLSVFGRSATYSAPTLTYVPQPTPAFNGVYTRLRDGSVTSTKFNKDLSLTANADLVPQVATHEDRLDEGLLNAISDMILNTGYNPLPGLFGETPTVSMVVLWDTAFHRAYKRLLDKLGGARMSDYFGTGEKKVEGVTPIRVPRLDNHAIRPIFVWNTSVMYYEKINGLWEADVKELRTGPTTYAMPKLDQCQLFCENLKYAGGMIHKSFSGST